MSAAGLGTKLEGADGELDADFWAEGDHDPADLLDEDFRDREEEAQMVDAADTTAGLASSSGSKACFFVFCFARNRCCVHRIAVARNVLCIQRREFSSRCCIQSDCSRMSLRPIVA